MLPLSSEQSVYAREESTEEVNIERDAVCSRPAGFLLPVISYSPNTKFLSFTEWIWIGAGCLISASSFLFTPNVFLSEDVDHKCNVHTCRAPALRVTHGCATRHCHHGNVSPTCATKIWPVTQTYLWDACEQKVWQHEARADLNRNTSNTRLFYTDGSFQRWAQSDRVWMTPRDDTDGLSLKYKRKSENFRAWGVIDHTLFYIWICLKTFVTFLKLKVKSYKILY